MRTLSLAACSLGLILSAPVSAADQPHYYLENDGLVVFEVEEGAVAEGWTLDTAVEGYTGNGFLEWTGPDRFHTDLAGEGTMAYRFRITTPGNYEVRWRSRIVRGEESTEHNDSWLRLPTGEDVPEEHPLSRWFKVYMNRPNAWSWDTHTVDHEPRKVRQFYDAGDHVLEISGRSAGHAIDRVVLYRYADVDFDAGRFQRLMPSETTTEPFAGATGDADGGSDHDEAGDGGETAGNADGGDGGDGGDGESVDEPPPHPVTDVSEHPPGECLDGRLVLAPSKDAYVGGDELLDGNSLRVDASGRRALIAYDLDGVTLPGTAELQLTVDDDDGRGTLRAYLASHTDWRAGEAAAKAPDSIVELGAASGSWTVGTRYSMPLDPTLLAGDGTAITLAVELDAGGDDVSFASSGVSGSAPLLLVEGGDSFCTDYDRAREGTGATAGDGNESAGEDGSDGEAGETGGSIDGETDAGSGGDSAVDGDVGTGGAGSGGGETGGGATSAGRTEAGEGDDTGTDTEERVDSETPDTANKRASGGGAGSALALLIGLAFAWRRTYAPRAGRPNLSRERD